MTKAARRSLIALAGLLLLLIFLLVLAAVLVETRWARDLLEDQISQRVGGREVEIGELEVDWGWPLGIHLRDFSIANPGWAEHAQMLQLAALDVTVDVGELLQGSVGLERVNLEQPVIHLARCDDGTSNWAALVPEKVDAEDVQQAAEEAPAIQPDVITISQGQLTYQDAGLDADVSVDFQTTGEGADARRLDVQAQGQVQGRPLQLSMQGDAPSQALAGGAYAVNLDGNLGEMEVRFDGQARNVTQLEALQGQLNVSVPQEADLASLLGQPALSVPSLDFQAQLNHQGQRWALEEIETQAGESRLTGLLAMKLALEQGDTPHFDIQLHADQLDLNRWGVMEMLEALERQTAEAVAEEATGSQDAESQEAAATAGESEATEGGGNLEQRLAQQLAPLRDYAGQAEITIGQLSYGDAMLHDLALQAQLDTGQLELQQLHVAQQDGELTAQGNLDVQPETLSGELNAQINSLDLGQALSPLGLETLGVLNGEVHTRFTEGVLALENTQLDYRAPAQALNVQLQAESREIAETQAPGVHLQGSGTRNDQDFRFDLTLGPLLDLNNPDQPFPVEGTLAAAGISAQLDGTLAQPLNPSAMDLSVQAQSDDLSTANQLVGLNLPADTPFRLEGRLLKEPQAQRWALQDLEAELGDNQLTGLLALEQGDTPRVDVQLHADRIDLNRWGVMARLASSDGEESEEPQEESEPLQQRLAEQLALLRRYRGQVDVSIDELVYGDEVLREVALQVTLDTGRLDVQQLHAVQGDGELAAEGRLDVQPDTVALALDAQIDQLDLGQAMAPFGFADLGRLDGEVHTRFADDILELHDTALDYRAPAQGLALQVQAETREREEAQAPGVHVEGSGSWQEELFSFNLDLGPLLSLNEPESPYSVQGALSSRDTALYIDGTITQPFAPESVDAEVRIEGPSPAELNRLLGQDLPALPAYQVQGRLRWHDTLLRLTGVQAEMGDSDINGDIRVEWEERPTLWATLTSRQLNESDFEAWWETEDEEEEEREPLFSDEPLNLEPLRNMDVVVDYSAIELNARHIPLSDVQLEAELRQGVLTLEPVRIGVGGGELNARLRADAQQAPLDGQLEVSLSQVELTPLIRKAELPETAEGASQDSAGTLGGKGQMSFQGRSVAELMAGLDGTLEFAVSRGYLDMLVVELLGLDVGESLIGALAEADTVPMHCAYARLNADQGLTELEQFYVGTQDTNFTAGGTINLGTEALDLTFEAHPKDPSLLSLHTPVQLQGSLNDLSISVISGDLVARGAASILGAIVAPPLAILPWVEPGTGDDVGPGCRQALEDYETANEQTGSELSGE